MEEIELKFEIHDFKTITRKVMNIADFKKSAHELTVMYDNPTKDLFKIDARLRLRRIIDLSTKKEDTEWSYKKPKSREEVKIEEELETEVGSFDFAEQILAKLHFKPVSSYERIRDTFMQGDVKITLDSFSFGHYLEIEGDLHKIKEIAHNLGLDMKLNITKSCDDLYAEKQFAQKKPVSDHIKLTREELTNLTNLRKDVYVSK